MSGRSCTRSSASTHRPAAGHCSSTAASPRTSSGFRASSDGLLALLYAHIERPEITLRHRWQTGDVLIWDNQVTSHYAVDDYGTSGRRVRRGTLAGDLPVGPDGFTSHIAEDPLVAIR